MTVPKKNRAKVALALKFKSVVIGILSLDLLIQVISLDSLHLKHIMTFISFTGEVQGLLTSRTTSLKILMCLSILSVTGLKSRFYQLWRARKILEMEGLATNHFLHQTMLSMSFGTGEESSVDLEHTVFKRYFSVLVSYLLIKFVNLSLTE